MINNKYCKFVKQSKAKQSKAKQSHNYILNNYFKFLFQKYFLHLVKTFLTSITFDSLSERNLCLVIKKFYSKGVCKNETHKKHS